MCYDSKNHQRALDAMQINLEAESRNKVEAMRVKKKLEQNINDLEMTLDGVNKAKAETERNFKKYQQQIRDLQQVPVTCSSLYVYCLRDGQSVGLTIERSRVQFPAVPLLCNDSGQVIHTHMCLCHQPVIFGTGPKCADYLRLEK